jgi:hypothetical protein
MTGHHFRGHTYDVEMTPHEFIVYKDGAEIARNPHGDAVRVPLP